GRWVVVVAAFPDWSRALATAVAFRVRLASRRRRAQALSLRTTVRLLPPGTVSVVEATDRLPTFSVSVTRQRVSLLGHLTRTVTLPLRDRRTRRGETDTRGARRSTAPALEVLAPRTSAPDPTCDGAAAAAPPGGGGGGPRLPLSSTARTRTVTSPATLGVQVYVQF